MKNESEHKKLPVYGTNIIGTFFRKNCFLRIMLWYPHRKLFFFICRLNIWIYHKTYFTTALLKA